MDYAFVFTVDGFVFVFSSKLGNKTMEKRHTWYFWIFILAVQNKRAARYRHMQHVAVAKKGRIDTYGSQSHARFSEILFCLGKKRSWTCGKIHTHFHRVTYKREMVKVRSKILLSRSRNCRRPGHRESYVSGSASAFLFSPKTKQTPRKEIGEKKENREKFCARAWGPWMLIGGPVYLPGRKSAQQVTPMHAYIKSLNTQIF